MTNTDASTDTLIENETPSALSSLTFEQLGLREDLLEGVRRLGFEKPTVIQEKMIPLALAGRDILGQSKTGSGKTAAFGLPMLQMIDPGKPFEGIILVPTRELAIQVTREIRELGYKTGVQVLAVYGGQPIKIQAQKLEKSPSLVVGTPGRVMDMHNRRLLPYDGIRFAVLDEVDRMLDIGFRDDIRRILGAMPKSRQTIFVSATISTEIERLARTYQNKPEKIELAQSRSLTVEQVRQSYFLVESWDKKRLLVHLLTHEGQTLTLVFCRTKQTVDALVEYLKRKSIDATAIHGDMYQRQRNRVMEKLRGGKLKVLVASDLASRGLDVENISHVINYDLPDDPDLYVHRIGRTARAGRDGIAWSFVTPEQGALLTAIEKYANVEIPKTEYPDFKPGPVPADVLAQREVDSKRRESRSGTLSRQAPPPPPAVLEAEQDPSHFPGGVVPTRRPPKRLGGKVRTRRR